MRTDDFNPFEPSVVFQIETKHLICTVICTVSQVTGFCIKSTFGWNDLSRVSREFSARLSWQQHLFILLVRCSIFGKDCLCNESINLSGDLIQIYTKLYKFIQIMTILSMTRLKDLSLKKSRKCHDGVVLTGAICGTSRKIMLDHCLLKIHDQLFCYLKCLSRP